jgi:hypothetical protein
VTSFEITVLLVCALLALTNTTGLKYHPHLKDMPGWYVILFQTLVLVTVASFLNTVYGALQ